MALDGDGPSVAVAGLDSPPGSGPGPGPGAGPDAGPGPGLGPGFPRPVLRRTTGSQTDLLSPAELMAVRAEAEAGRQLVTRMTGEVEELTLHKRVLKSAVRDLQKENDALRAQVLFLRRQLSQAQLDRSESEEGADGVARAGGESSESGGSETRHNDEGAATAPTS